MDKNISFELSPKKRDGSTLFDFKFTSNLHLVPCGVSLAKALLGKAKEEMTADRKKTLKNVGIAVAATTASALLISAVIKKD